MPRLLISPLVIWLYASVAFAQSADSLRQQARDAHFIIGAGGSYVNVIDEGISPLLYQGPGGAASLGHRHQNGKALSSSLVRFDFNSLTSNVSQAEMYSYRLFGSFQHYRKLSQANQKLKVYPGFELSARWALRDHLSFTNNSQHIETRFSLAPAVLLARPFKLWKRAFVIGFFSQMPILTYATRPPFASTKFPASLNKENPEFFDYVKDGTVVSLNKYFRWNSQTYLHFPFKNGNGLRLDYFWSLESYQDINPIRTGEHALTISTFIKL